MRKNNKGFTLIELIAVVALLGILSVLVVPKIFSLVTDSRKNVYVQDAKRMIAQAQYVITSKNAEIQKPKNDGEQILLSLLYLGSNSFQDAPNGGEYLTSESFVVVEKDGKEFKYSAVLIEKYTKNGQTLYMGIQDATEEQLSAKNAISYVQSIYEDKNIITLDINPSYTYYSDYDETDKYSKVQHVYHNEQEFEGNVESSSAPFVKDARFESKDKLKPKLVVTIQDMDSEASDIKIGISTTTSTSVNKDTYYEKAKNKAQSLRDDKKTDNVYTYSEDLDFTSYGYGKDVTIFIYVEDEKSLFTKKQISYSLKNEAPVIKKFSISSADQKVDYNSPNVNVLLELEDDTASQEDLYICFAQDNKNCTSYQKYSSLFKNGVYQYTFKDSSNRDFTVKTMDGKAHNLTVYVRDPYDSKLVVNKTCSYNLAKNEAPVIKSYQFQQDCISELQTDSNKCSHYSLSTSIRIDAYDTITPSDQLTITIYEEGNRNRKKLDYTNSEIPYTLSGSLDGKARTIYVIVTDKQDKSSEPLIIKTNTVYKDKAPEIKSFKLVSYEDYPCLRPDACDGSSDGGSYRSTIQLDVKDDLVDEDEIEVCFSENSNASECDGKYETYSSFDNIYYFNKTDYIVQPGEADYDFLAEKLKVSKDELLRTNPTDIKPFETIYVPKKYGKETKKYSLAVYVRQKNTSLMSKAKADYSVYHDQSPSYLLDDFTIYSQSDEVQSASVKIDISTEIPDTDDENIEEYTPDIQHEDSEGGTGESVDSDSKEDTRYYNWDYYIKDDFQSYDLSLCYYIGDPNKKDNKPICKKLRSILNGKENNSDDILDSILNDKSFTFTDEEGNDVKGATIYAYLELVDTYLDSSTKIRFPSKESEYKIYDINAEIAPIITSFDITSLAERLGYNDVQTTVSFSVSDPGDTFTYCLTEGNSCLDGDYSEETFPANNDIHRFRYDFLDTDHFKKNLKRKLTLYVKDSKGNITISKTLNYDIYEECSTGSDNFSYILDFEDSYRSKTSINPKNCNGKCYHNVKSSVYDNDPGLIIDQNDIFGIYRRKIAYKDQRLSDTFCEKEKDSETYCDYKSCYDPQDQEESYYVSLYVEDLDLKWVYKNSHVVIEEKTDCGDNPDCVPETLKEPVSFVCSGYYETYSSKVVNGVVTLTKTPIRICPVFFKEAVGKSYNLGDDYLYNKNDVSTYIQFSKDEFESNFISKGGETDEQS